MIVRPNAWRTESAEQDVRGVSQYEGTSLGCTNNSDSFELLPKHVIDSAGVHGNSFLGRNDRWWAGEQEEAPPTEAPIEWQA